jgi:hypothetical protein
MNLSIDMRFWLQIVVLIVSLIGSYAALASKFEKHIEATEETLRVNREICSAVKTLVHLPVDSCYITER